MAERIVSLGDPLGFYIQIRWPKGESPRNAESATHGELLLWVQEHLVWGALEADGKETPVEWSWVELLEFLSNAWPYLAFESGYPLGLRPYWPAKLRDAAEVRWESVPNYISEKEEEELFAFEETHDLARGLHGLFAPSIWLVRESGLMSIGICGDTVRRPVKETLDTLECLGEEIRKRIAALDDERSTAAVSGWDDRLSLSPWALAEIATHWPEEELRQAAGTDDPWQAFGIEGEQFYMTESLEVAGLARGFLGVEQLHHIFDLLNSVSHLDTPELDQLGNQVSAQLKDAEGERPYTQGYLIARLLRDQPGVVDPHGRVDIERIIVDFGVRLAEVDLGNDLLDAIACWGPRCGPVIWINAHEKHTKVEGARRSTLAHELCHLLIDRSGALPLADVVNGNVPRWVEKRANAFAAELLLPRHLATVGIVADTDIRAHVERLTKQYGVSRELTARQIDNSEIPLSPAHSAVVKSMFSRPERF